MKLETKFDLGQCVYFMHENNVCYSDIKQINIRCTRGIPFLIEYGFKERMVNEPSPYESFISQNLVFASKEELLKSL